MASPKRSHLDALVAFVDAQIVLAKVCVETLLQLKELKAHLDTYFFDLRKVDLLPRERWSALHWIALRREQTSQQDLRLMTVAMAHLSSVGEHGCDEQRQGGVSTSYDLLSSRLRTIPFCHSRLLG